MTEQTAAPDPSAKTRPDAALHPGQDLQAARLRLGAGRELRYVQAGQGSPVVVFEAGLSGCASDWVTVQRLVAHATRTVSYDRAGYAGSTRDPQPRTLTRVCADLSALIERVSPDAPVVLVGHSWGGPIVRCYAEHNPGRVAGVVLVDATTTAVMTTRRAALTKASLGAVYAGQRLHLDGLLRRLDPVRASPDVSDDDRAIRMRDAYGRRTAAAALAEAKAIPASLPLLQQWESEGLPDVPVISLVGADPGPGVSDAVRAAIIRRARNEMREHPRGQCRVIPGTGHLVPHEQPRATADAVLDLSLSIRLCRPD